jgi:hypothetical protein
VLFLHSTEAVGHVFKDKNSSATVSISTGLVITEVNQTSLDRISSQPSSFGITTAYISSTIRFNCSKGAACTVDGKELFADITLNSRFVQVPLSFQSDQRAKKARKLAPFKGSFNYTLGRYRYKLITMHSISCCLTVNLTLQSIHTAPSISNALTATTAADHITATFGLDAGVTIKGNNCTAAGNCTYSKLAIGDHSYTFMTTSSATNDTVPNNITHVLKVTRGKLVLAHSVSFFLCLRKCDSHVYSELGV